MLAFTAPTRNFAAKETRFFYVVQCCPPTGYPPALKSTTRKARIQETVRRFEFFLLPKLVLN